MNKLKNFKMLTIGFFVGAIFFSGISYAATNKVNLEAVFGVKLIQNGIDKTPKDKKPFIVDGSTYVPLRTVSDLLGTQLTWDGKNNAVIIGEKIVGIPLGTPDSVTVNSLTNPSITSNQEMKINGKAYGNIGFTLISKQAQDSWKDSATILKYNFNNQYSKLQLAMGIDDNSSDSTDSILRNVVFKDQDGRILKEVSLGKGSVKENIEIDLTGVLMMLIEVDGQNGLGAYAPVSLDFINPLLTAK